MTPHYGQAFLSRPAARAQRTAAGLVAAALVAWSVKFGVDAQQAIPHLPALIPVWVVIMMLTQGFTALLLGFQASQLRHVTLAMLAGGYTFMCLGSLLKILAYPGVASANGWAIAQGWLPWLNVLIHYVFPPWVLLAVWQMDRQTKGWVLWSAWLVPTLVAPVLAFVLFQQTDLPILWQHHHYTGLLQYTLLPLNVGLVAAVLGVMSLQTRLRTRLHLWLGVVLIAQMCEVGLSTLAGHPLTVGGVGAQVISATASVVLLGALLWDIHDIHRTLQHTNAQLHAHATFDHLTGALMRRPFFEAVAAALESPSCALIMMDVDHFKAYNDAYGHLAGDVCLSTVVQAARVSLPKKGVALGRLGGEEFAVLLTGPAVQKADLLAETVRAAVWREHVPHSRSIQQAWVTVSVGWSLAHRGDTAETLVERADQALYQAKREGRNQVCKG